MVMKAIEVVAILDVLRSEFKASIEWCRRMMRRFGLTQLPGSTTVDNIGKKSMRTLSSNDKQLCGHVAPEVKASLQTDLVIIRDGSFLHTKYQNSVTGNYKFRDGKH
ncbi:hypothetical protein PR048_019878 [Dryococelus australis]|uniref:Uncharacterized protein n=1 Tax=Dryococelus australis TaxID=614101 RepID=A0ABQ9H4Q1_9NEOP|nr:hypothetical protein PR048_019878 [Dryococelus australis]